MDKNPVQESLFSRLRNRLTQIEQRTVFDAFLILLIVIGLATTVFLARERQIIRSGAAENGTVLVVDEQGQEVSKEGENFIVETQQIRLKIEFPTNWSQSFLPDVINPAYAQIPPEEDPERKYCAAADGNRYEDGKIVATCTGWDNKPANSHPWCKWSVNAYFFSSCTYSVTQPTPTATTAPAQQSCPGQCASPKDQTSAVTITGSTCTSYLGNSAYDTNCRSKNTGYDWCYTSCAQPAAVPTAIPAQASGCGASWEGKRTECSADANRNAAGCIYLDSWSRPRSTVCGETTPFCWACPESAFGAPAQPTAPPPQTTTAPAVGGPQAPAPTATPTPEPQQTQYIQVSLKQDKLGKDKCTRTSNPEDDCLQFSITDPYFTQRGNQVDVWLPSERKTYTIYIGFISDKGNYKSAQVKVTYRPKSATTPSPRAAGSPTSVLDTLAGAANVSCINGRALQSYPNETEGIDTGYFCRCKPNASGDVVVMIVDPETGKDLTETNSPCQGGLVPKLNLSGSCSDDGTKINFSWNSIPSDVSYAISSKEEGVVSEGISIGIPLIPENWLDPNYKNQTSYTKPIKPGFTYKTSVQALDKKSGNIIQESNTIVLTCKAVDDEGKSIVNKGPCPGTCANSLTKDELGRTCSGGEWSINYTCPNSQYPLCVTNATCSIPLEEAFPSPPLAPPSEEFDTSKACADQYSPCVKTLQEQGITYTEAANQCGKKRSICTDYKNARCQEEYSRCGRPAGLYCFIPYQWCKALIR
ncbi:MAG: hypothetical protein HYU49_01440 [Candidatus Levybacteria bacterium]|nr:hypothetical protein [Candidatus Levybacteria bacterium]MBI3093082.1 hypothetical protein [Candidatus Levybacteria bacterium]